MEHRQHARVVMSVSLPPFLCLYVVSVNSLIHSSLSLTSGLEMKEMARPFVPNLPALPTLCKYWSLCGVRARDKVGEIV